MKKSKQKTLRLQEIAREKEETFLLQKLNVLTTRQWTLTYAISFPYANRS